MLTRAKFICSAVTKRVSNTWNPDGTVGPNEFEYDADLYPVTGGSDENKRFFASTPSGSIRIGTVRDELFIPGKAYYVDFSVAE